MNNYIEDLVKTSPFCQAVTPSSQIEPLNLIHMSSHPWEYLYAGLCSPASEYIFTVEMRYYNTAEILFVIDLLAR